jgi:hypothetical protein
MNVNRISQELMDWNPTHREKRKAERPKNKMDINVITTVGATVKAEDTSVCRKFIVAVIAS